MAMMFCTSCTLGGSGQSQQARTSREEGQAPHTPRADLAGSYFGLRSTKTFYHVDLSVSGSCSLAFSCGGNTHVAWASGRWVPYRGGLLVQRRHDERWREVPLDDGDLLWPWDWDPNGVGGDARHVRLVAQWKMDADIESGTTVPSLDEQPPSRGPPALPSSTAPALEPVLA